VVRLTQGIPPVLTLNAAIESGPMKPGNSVEGKTLTTRKEAWMPQYRHWDMGSRGREGIVIPLRSRIRAAGKDEGTRKPKGDGRIYRR